MYRILDHAGRLRRGLVSPLPNEGVLEAVRWMMLSRAYDVKAIALQRQNRAGIVSPSIGQEATVVGSAMAFSPVCDWLVPQYRDVVAYFMWGMPISSHILARTGNTTAGRIPEAVRMLPPQAALAAQLPHAVGLAWGLKLQKKDGIVLTYCGDGASSEGDFHELLNLPG